MQPPFQLLHLDHIVLRSAAPDGLIEFYRLLGGDVERILDELGLTQIRFGTAILDIVDTAKPLGRSGGSAPKPGAGHNVDHFAVRIEPFDASALANFASHHGIPHQLHDSLYGADGFGPSIYLSDPDGNRIELKGPPSE